MHRNHCLEPVWTRPCRNLDKILVTPMKSVLVGRLRPQTQEPNRLYRSLNCGFGALNTVVARLWCNALGPWDKSQAFNSASYTGRRESVKWGEIESTTMKQLWPSSRPAQATFGPLCKDFSRTHYFNIIRWTMWQNAQLILVFYCNRYLFYLTLYYYYIKHK